MRRAVSFRWPMLAAWLCTLPMARWNASINSRPGWAKMCVLSTLTAPPST
jgi:hypothetical protein